MLFPTVQFTVFFVLVFAATCLVRPRVDGEDPFDRLRSSAWRLGMVAASLYFYTQAPRGYEFVWLLVGSIAGNWCFGRLIARSLGPNREPTPVSRCWVGLGVTGNLAVLGWHKYYGFFVDDIVPVLSAVPGLGWVELAWVEVFLPVGISFFTFQAISYIVDIGRGVASPLPPLDFALYLSFFPQLVAGPIVRATEFAPQLGSRREETRSMEAVEAFHLIGRGLVKKVVISSYVADAVVEPAFNAPSLYSGAELLWAVYAYAIQIYMDFSGYTDIAIGCALLLGFRFPQNFDSPYRALSIQEFWRRWHKTLSRWLRDYLYIPLGGSRCGPGRTYLNLLVTMVLGGLWHGADWKFIIWGTIHGGVLAIERYVGSIWPWPPSDDRRVAAVKWAITFHIVCLAWIFFRAEDTGTAIEVIRRIATGAPGTDDFVLPWLLPVVVVTMMAGQFVPEQKIHIMQDRFSQLGLGWQVLAIGIVLLFVGTCGSVAEFIYFQF